MTDYTKIKELIDVELNEAIKKKGTFVDGHQAYGVICEEMCEAGEELAEVTKMIDDMWVSVRKDDEEGIFDAADKGYNYTVDAIRELIQVAAMFKKVSIRSIKIM